MAKVIFRNSDFRQYRIPFYDLLCKKHEVRFIFKHYAIPSRYDQISLSGSKSSFWSDRAFIKRYLGILFSNYDIFITSLPTNSISVLGIILSRLRRKKIVFWNERWLVPSGKGLKVVLKNTYFKLIYRLADSYFVSGSRAEKFIISYGNANRRTIFKALQANIDMSRFFPEEPDIQVPEGHIVFLYIGRFIKLKGINYLIEAFFKISMEFEKVTLIIIGNGELKTYYESLVQNLELANVLFLPPVDDNNNSLKAGFYNFCDVLILPSTIVDNQTEGWGLTVGEAMSLGKPVIVTDAVGCSDDLVIDGINGYIVKHGSSESLAEALSKMVRDKDNLIDMGRKSREIYEAKISFEKMADELSNAIDFAMKP